MAYTLDDIKALEALIATGARAAESGDRRLDLRSLNDLQKTLAIMKAEVYGTTSTTKSAIGSRRIAVTSKGLL